MHFQLGNQANPNGGTIALKPRRFDDPGWKTLRDVAIATGAFPIALAPRLLSHTTDVYTTRFPETMVPETKEPKSAARTSRRVRFPYSFLSVDGGLIDNEPLDLAREYFRPVNGGSHALGHDADHAVIMIAPFPGDIVDDPDYEKHLRTRLLDSAGGMVFRLAHSLIEQARFRSVELRPEEILHRFMIAPRRIIDDDQKIPDTHRIPEPFALACGSLYGFGGFLDRAFREHDYHLGRWNCQQFLRHYFALPADHRLFSSWSKEAKAREEFRIAKTRDVLPPGYPGKEWEVNQRPIIPLMGAAGPATAGLPAWPTFHLNRLAEFRSLADQRISKVFIRLAEQLVPAIVQSSAWQRFWHTLTPPACALVSKFLVGRLIGEIEKELRERGQWPESSSSSE
jgi:hypothetical protein